MVAAGLGLTLVLVGVLLSGVGASTHLDVLEVAGLVAVIVGVFLVALTLVVTAIARASTAKAPHPRPGIEP